VKFSNSVFYSWVVSLIRMLRAELAVKREVSHLPRLLNGKYTYMWALYE
jgi:hypothetical protein